MVTIGTDAARTSALIEWTFEEWRESRSALSFRRRCYLYRCRNHRV